MTVGNKVLDMFLIVFFLEKVSVSGVFVSLRLVDDIVSRYL